MIVILSMVVVVGIVVEAKVRKTVCSFAIVVMVRKMECLFAAGTELESMALNRSSSIIVPLMSIMSMEPFFRIMALRHLLLQQTCLGFLSFKLVFHSCWKLYSQRFVCPTSLNFDPNNVEYLWFLEHLQLTSASIESLGRLYMLCFSIFAIHQNCSIPAFLAMLMTNHSSPNQENPVSKSLKSMDTV